MIRRVWLLKWAALQLVAPTRRVEEEAECALQLVIEVFATVKLDGHTKPLISRSQRDIL